MKYLIAIIIITASIYIHQREEKVEAKEEMQTQVDRVVKTLHDDNIPVSVTLSKTYQKNTFSWCGSTNNVWINRAITLSDSGLSYIIKRTWENCERTRSWRSATETAQLSHR
jgi:uncharacterized protein (DUF1697 family)